MRLKELEIQGFKSFPDKTKIEIGEGITGVVGPNGSGKSNISDSIRWVLGETSSKQLRGSGKMEDVIFGGTQSRGAMGYASVALTIDNSDHGLDMDADEVTIGRRYYRSGESEYSINGQNVRLKDVYELLLDTGIGRDGYAIVGQGRIAEIVGAKSAERREIFEEASGIAKYRYRKNEAERRLDAAEGNLERLRDILGELEKRVGPLKRDSEKAQQFLELSERRKTLEITLWVDAIRRANDSLRDQQRKYEAAQADYDRLSRQLDEFDEKSASLRAEAQQLMLAVEQANADIRAITEANAGSESEIAVLKNESEHSRFRIDEAASELERAGQGRESIEREAADHRAAIEALKSGMAGLDARVAELREALRALEEKAAASGERRDVIDAAMARLQDTATAARVSAASAQSAGEAAANRQAEAQRQAEELKAGAAATDEERRRAERRFKDAEEAVTRNDNIKAGLKLKLDSRRRQQAEAADNLQKADRERSAAAHAVEAEAARVGLCNANQTVSITKDFDGKTLDHLLTLPEDIKFITEDGNGVMNNAVMARAFAIATERGLTIMSHAEDREISPWDYRLAENIETVRNCHLAEYYGTRLHMCHVSTRESVDAVRMSRMRGARVSCEVTPHHLWFDDSRLTYRVNPPIRKADDVTALIDAIKDGTVTCIGTDHAPHTAEEKEKGAAGMVGLETAFGVCYTKLCREQRLPLEMLSFLMSAGPAAVLGLADRKGMLEPGYDADIVLVDLDHMYEVHADELHSKSKNCPYDGALLYGKVVTTIKGGKVTFQIEE